MVNGYFTDEQIIKKVLRGDIDLFGIIVQRYQKYIFNLGMQFHKNMEDAYDFVQDVFIKAFDKLRTFKGISKFSFWLFRIAYNHGINSSKGNIADSSLIETLIQNNDITPEKKHLREEIGNALMEAIVELPEHYGLCLNLYFFYGLPYSEIEKITDIPMNTIKSNIFRAKKILRNSLKGTIAEEYYEMR